jgi:hypothetical protein
VKLTSTLKKGTNEPICTVGAPGDGCEENPAKLVMGYGLTR